MSTTSPGSGPARLAVLLSGRGSNFVALHEAVERGGLPAEIALVVSNVAGAPGLDKARSRGLQAVVIPSGDPPDRDRGRHEAAVLEALDDAGVDWICLAGYMRLLSPRFVRTWPRRIVNIHPSLLPSFPGLEAPRQAVEHGVKVSGCTVHLVDEGLDSGPIVLQRAVRVEDGDTPEDLAARILQQEHVAYAEAMRRLLTEPWTIEGRRLLFGGDSANH